MLRLRPALCCPGLACPRCMYYCVGVCSSSGTQHSVLRVRQQVGCAHRCIPDLVDLSRHGCLLTCAVRCMSMPLPVARQLRMQCLPAGIEGEDVAVPASTTHALGERHSACCYILATPAPHAAISAAQQYLARALLMSVPSTAPKIHASASNSRQLPSTAPDHGGSPPCAASGQGHQG